MLASYLLVGEASTLNTLSLTTKLERHLWVNLADIGKKEKNFLLNALELG